MRGLVFYIIVGSSAMIAQANAQNCPDETEWGAEITGAAADFYFPQRYDLVAGGGVSVQACFDEEGYVTTAPDFTVDLRDLQGYDISFRTESSCDTMLLVNMPDSRWRYNDDIPGRLDSEVRLSEQLDGYYDVWVGTVGPGMCDATLVIETFSTS